MMLAILACLFLFNAPFSLQAPGRVPEISVTQQEANARKSDHQTAKQIIKTAKRASSDTATLSELVNKRPANHHTDRMIRFATLFANHPKVKELDRYVKPIINLEALKAGWTSLRRQEYGQYNHRKMQDSIAYHLRFHAKVDENIVKAIRYHWRNEQDKKRKRQSRDRLSNATTPELIAKHIKSQEKKALSQRERVARIKMGKKVTKSFEEYMAEYNIPKGLSALELEVKSRAFRHKYGIHTPATATIALRDYLVSKHFASLDIQLALGTRSDVLRRGQRKKYMERKAKGQVGSSSSHIQEEQEDQSLLDSGDNSSNRSGPSNREDIKQSSGNDVSNTRSDNIQKLLDSKAGWHSTSNL